jgi:hypothetical protein
MKVFSLLLLLSSVCAFGQLPEFDKYFKEKSLPYLSTKEFFELPYYEFRGPKDFDLTELDEKIVEDYLGIIPRIYDEYDSRIDKFYARYKLELGENLIGYVVYHELQDSSENPAPTNDYCYRSQLFIFNQNSLLTEFNFSRFYEINGKRWFSYSEILKHQNVFRINRFHVEVQEQKSDEKPSRIERFEWMPKGYLHESGHHKIR